MSTEENRRSRKYSRRELAGRFLWAACTPLFRCSPRLCWGWRRFLLRLFGARIGSHVHIHPAARIFIPWNLEIGSWSYVGFDVLLYNLVPMKIGEGVTVSQRAHLCGGTHDFRDESMPLVKSTVTIGDGAWICADAFIGPGVRVGECAVVGARAVATRHVASGAVVAGNPARVVGARGEKPRS